MAKAFDASRQKAKSYYLFQKRQSFAYREVSLLRLLSPLRLNLLRKQTVDYFLISQYLQEERYYISLLYEDYILPLRSRSRLKMDFMLHENLYKKRFLMQLHKRQYISHHSFLKKQRCERMLHFLWCLKRFQLLSQEKNQQRLLNSPKTFYFYPSCHRPQRRPPGALAPKRIS